MALLAVTDLCVNYGEIEALRGLRSLSKKAPS